MEAFHTLPEGKDETPLKGQTSYFLLMTFHYPAPPGVKKWLLHFPSAGTLKKVIIFPILKFRFPS
jgi:hypothetical protein